MIRDLVRSTTFSCCFIKHGIPSLTSLLRPRRARSRSYTANVPTCGKEREREEDLSHTLAHPFAHHLEAWKDNTLARFEEGAKNTVRFLLRRPDARSPPLAVQTIEAVGRDATMHFYTPLVCMCEYVPRRSDVIPPALDTAAASTTAKSRQGIVTTKPPHEKRKILPSSTLAATAAPAT